MLPPRVSLAQIGTRVRLRRSASAWASSILHSGSSTQYTSKSSNAWQMRSAAVLSHRLCSSTMISMRSPTAARIWRNASQPLRTWSRLMVFAPGWRANWSNGQIFMAV
ncbi:hypothetical protein D3C76_1496320 [compost metagenome]